jgi:F-box/leucine-rich repeat protein 10/11
VIGGNFLNSFNIGAQLRVYEIEEATDVPLKFRFPFYMRLNWYALSKFEQWLSEETRNKLSYFELESMAVLASFLRNELVSENETKKALTPAERKLRQIPDSIKDPIGLTDRVMSLVKATIKGNVSPTKVKSPSPPKQKIVLRVKAPPSVKESKDDDFYEQGEEEEEDFHIDEEDDEEEEIDMEDEEYKLEDDEDTIPVIETNNKKTTSKKKKVIQKEDSDSSSDDDSMGTSKGKPVASLPNRKRSLASNSVQKSTKQRLLDRISSSKRY